MSIQYSSDSQYAGHLPQRDVSSTARLFNFNRPVYMTDSVWHDCVELMDRNGKTIDELAVLQRLRHVLFMASSALHGRVKDVECEFRIHRVPNDKKARHPEATTLKIEAHSDQFNQPVITIKHPNE
ncbi:MAG: hypothetical protein OQL06_04810 [Gammaproteobacteria bacterium]|nr:hypothetical protein [Gammaproteobacteria bacterium]